MNWLISTIRVSYQNLIAHKLRSFLTILGVIIGVAAVIVIFSIGQSAQDLILSQLRGVGSNLVAVIPGAADEEGPPAAAFGIAITTLKYEDLEELRDEKNVPEVEAGAGYVTGTAIVTYEGEEKTASYVGTTASYLDVENTEVEKGRFFIEDEETNLSRVAVIGSTIAQDLFGDEDPVNKKIEIKDQKLTIIGVMEERGAAAFGMSNQDESIFIPLKTTQELILGINHLGFVRLKVRNEELINSAKANVLLTMREQHDIDDPALDDFSVRDMASALETLTNVTNVLRYFLLAIGTISLLVGGVGIMNIMLISVHQRIREIGVRRAVGAKKIDILIQFIAESATVSFIGGVIGIIVGIGVSFLAAVIIQALGFEWNFILSFWSILVASAVSIAIGVIFGAYPARKASKVSPMEALRYE